MHSKIKSNLKKALIDCKTTIKDAISSLDKNGIGILILHDGHGSLVGVVTDGNIRRAILNNVNFSLPISKICTKNPVTASERIDIAIARQIMDDGRGFYINHLPLLDSDGNLSGLLLRKDLDSSSVVYDNPVVLMAGGLGTRLRPLTDRCPKPMLAIGQKPILHTIIDNFKDQGFHKFYVAVNYKSEIIENYFGNGSKFDVSITYLHEKKRLGTAGALSLLPENPDTSLIVMNGDILTKVDFQQLLDFHEKTDSPATMCVREYDFQVPYGVVNVEGSALKGLQEKPVHSFFVNAGIYVLRPDILKFVPNDEFYDITTLFEQLSQQSERPNVFPLREYWIDIGQINDFTQATNDFDAHFCSVD